MKKNALFALPIIGIALAGFFYISNVNKCGELCERDFWKFAEVEDVKELIDAGANVNLKNNGGQTPLYRAARQGDVDSIMALIDAGAEVNYDVGQIHQPLHEAIGGPYEQKAENVAALLAAGAMVDARSPIGATALHIAAANPSTQIVSMLIEAGADVNMQILNEGYYKGNTPLHSAVISGPIDNFSILIENGANINAQNGAGSTPLHLAAQAVGVEKITALLALDADGAIFDRENKTPFDLLAANERTIGTPAFLALQTAADK